MIAIVIGGGLAGSEAAWVLASRGLRVKLTEMKPLRFSPAHTSPALGELVCSNSLRSDVITSAPGLLKEELGRLDSLIMQAARETSVPAGKALAVDRDRFATFITEKIEGNPLITIQRDEVTRIPRDADAPVIVATGPLTSDALAADITELLGADGLSFYDAIAPIVTAESLDTDIIFRASRYGAAGEEGDYLNAPMDEETYRSFVDAIRSSEKVDPHPFEKIPHFEGCLPVEELAARGRDTLAFGPMKPVGLVDPRTGRRPFAVAQLRSENKERTLYNLVGFQTKMTHPEQERVFRMIPGLERAVFARLGSIHRNTYLDSPRLLDRFSQALALPHLYFAGQITGVEGYIESTASGLAVGIMAGLVAHGIEPEPPPSTTAVGALLKHTQNRDAKKFEPMNVNFGLIDPPPPGTRKHTRKQVQVERALEDIEEWKRQTDELWKRAGSFDRSDPQ